MSCPELLRLASASERVEPRGDMGPPEEVETVELAGEGNCCCCCAAASLSMPCTMVAELEKANGALGPDAFVVALCGEELVGLAEATSLARSCRGDLVGSNEAEDEL